MPIKEFSFSDELAESARIHPSGFTRQRSLPLPHLVSMLLNLRKGSIGDELGRFFEILHDEPLAEAVTPSAFCQARKRLNPRALMGLNRPLLEGFQRHFSPRLWHGWRLLAVDGSTARLPNTDDVIATTVDPFISTPEEVLDALFQEAPACKPPPSHPRPCHKYVRAALQRDDMDSTEPQVQAIFGWMAEQVAQRNPDANKDVVLLMDGQDSLWKAGWVLLPEELTEVTEILDLLHALGYLWDGAHLFHPKKSNAARAFVKEQARRILHGDVAAVIRSLRWLGTHHKLKGKRRQTLERICGYFHNNAHRMAYDAYLEHGFPIASGVIEGACRCVLKDRMERSGMRWVMPGARAMLDMRCGYLSDLWEEFATFRFRRESRRLYPGFAANDADFSQPFAA